MSSDDAKGKVPGLFSLGLLLLLFAVFSRMIEMEFTTYAWIAGGAGLLAIAISVAANHRPVGRFFRAYWIVLAFVLSVLVALFLPEAWIEKYGLGDRIPEWVARVVVLLVLEGLAVLVFATTRERGTPRAEKAAVAANVTFLLQLGVGLLVAANVIGSTWLSSKLGSLDTTEMQVYSLSERTQRILDDLPGTVYATYLDLGSSYRAMPNEEPLGTRGRDFLKQYADYSPDVVMKVLDPVRDKAEAEEYLREIGVDEFEFGSEDTVLFTYTPDGADEPHRKDVTVTLWSFLETSRLGTRKFKGEQLYTSAIVDVVHEKKKVYVLKGHGELPLFGGRGPSLSEASEIIRKLALDVESLSLTERGKVPDDADLLLIPGPKAPLLPEEVDKIVSYLEKGGSLILALDPQESLRMPNSKRQELGLEKYLAELGIEPRTDFVCVDYDIQVGTTGTGSLTKTLTVTTADYAFHPIVEDLSARDFACRFTGASPVMVEKDEGEGDDDLTTEELVYVRRTQPGFGLRTYAAKLSPGRDPGAELEGDIVGERMPVGVAAERKVGGEKEGRATRVVVFGDSDFMTNGGLKGGPAYAIGNASLLSNAVSWAVQRESLISIEPKTLESETVTLGEREERLAYWVGVWAIPVLVLFFALGMAWKRRR